VITVLADMSKNPPLPKRFDPAVLESMVEPLFIRVERRSGGASTPIDLPPEEGMPTGFSKERVKTLETWLVTEWTGGGVYFFIVSDSSTPAQKMEWLTTYDPKVYPARQPPTMAGAAITPMAPMVAPTPFQPQAPQVSMSSSPWPSGFQYAQPAAPPPQIIMPQQSQMPFTPFSPQDRQSQVDRERLEREKQELQAKVAAAEKRETEERHQRELDRIRQDNERALAELKASIAPKTDPAIDARFARLESILEKLVERPAQTGPSPETLAMQKAIDEANRRNEELQREMQRQREKDEAERRAENERRERERVEQMLREDMRRQEASFKEMIANLTAMIAKLEAKPTGPDPIITFMQESNRQNVEAMRDMMRQSQQALDNLRTMMMTPRDVLALAKEGQGGVDELRRQLTGTYTDVMTAYRSVLETAMQLQPQGESPTIGVIKDGLTQAKEFADRYFGNKSKETIEHLRAQRAVAEAHVRSGSPGVVPPPVAQAAPSAVNPDLAQQAAQESGGLSGAVITPPPVYVPDKNATTPGGALPQGQPSNVIPISTVQNAQGVVTSPKRTDEQWFGPALDSVKELRAAATLFLESIQKGEEGIDPKTKQIKGASPEQAVNAILQATAVIAQQQMPIPAFTELFMQERIADFVDVLLPDPIAQVYRDDVIKIVYERLKADGDEDEDEDDEDEGDDENDKEDAS
jgi:hypothetical protein